MAEPKFSLNNLLNTKAFCVLGILKQWCDLEGYFLRYFHQFIDVNAIVCIISKLKDVNNHEFCINGGPPKSWFPVGFTN